MITFAELFSLYLCAVCCYFFSLVYCQLKFNCEYQQLISDVVELNSEQIKILYRRGMKKKTQNHGIVRILEKCSKSSRTHYQSMRAFSTLNVFIFILLKQRQQQQHQQQNSGNTFPKTFLKNCVYSSILYLSYYHHHHHHFGIQSPQILNAYNASYIRNFQTQ